MRLYKINPLIRIGTRIKFEGIYVGTDDEALIEFVRKHSPLTVPKECSITTTQAEEMQGAE